MNDEYDELIINKYIKTIQVTYISCYDLFDIIQLLFEIVNSQKVCEK